MPDTPDPELVETFAAALVALEEHARLSGVIREFAVHFEESNPLNPASRNFLLSARAMLKESNECLRTFREALGAHLYEARIESERAIQSARWKKEQG